MPTPARLAKVTKVADQRQPGLIIVLEDIHDPHNAEAIIRSCDAYGIAEVWFIFEQEKRYNPAKVGKVTSSSANKWVNFKIFTSTVACMSTLRRQKYQIIATALNPAAKSLYTADLTGTKVALLVGNEHRGLSAEALKKADLQVYIPMIGMVQSLNVSVTTGTVLFEVTRQRLLHPGKYKMTLAEKKRLLRVLLAK